MNNLMTKLFATLLLTLNVYIVGAQNLLIQSVSGNDPLYPPVNKGGVWHVVTGKSLQVILKATKPADTNEKRWAETIQFARENTPILGNEDTFTPIASGNVKYSATFTYTLYTYNEESGQWETDGILHQQTATENIALSVHNDPTLRNFKINAGERFTYVGAPNVNMSVSYDEQDFTPVFEWSLNGQKTPNTGNSYSFEPNEPIKDARIKCVAKVFAPDDKTQWGSSAEDEILLTVYKKPVIKSVNPVKYYTYQGAEAFGVSVELDNPDNLPYSITWDNNMPDGEVSSFNPISTGKYNLKATAIFTIDPEKRTTVKDEKTSPVVTVYNKPSFISVEPKKSYTYDQDNDFEVKANVSIDTGIKTSVEWQGASGTGLNASFSPTEAGAGEKSVQAKVTFTDPNDNILLSDTKSCKIKVYNTPTTTLKSDRKFAMAGDNAFDITLLIDNNKDNLNYDVDWSQNVTPYPDNINKASFNPLAADTYTFTASVKFKDENNDELFTPKAEVKVKVFGEAFVNENDCHKNEQDKGNDYSVYENDGFALSELLERVGGNDEGWIFQYSIDDGEKKDASFVNIKPTAREQAYKIDLFVSNNDPDGKELLHEMQKTYYLSVFANPKWSILDDGSVFDKNDDKLHVLSNDEVVITAQLTAGKADLWTTTCGEASLTGVGKNRTYTFQEAKEKEYTLTFDFKYEIPNLYRGSENKANQIFRTIYVWEKIEASIAENQELDQFQAGDDVIIKLDITGGNPAKWNITCDQFANGRWNPIDQTFTISKIALKKGDDKSSIYEIILNANYKDGQTRTNDQEFPLTLTVYNEPYISAYFYVIEDKDLIFEQTQHGDPLESTRITCYEDDKMELCLNLQGGNSKGKWMYEIMGTQKQDLNDVPEAKDESGIRKIEMSGKDIRNVVLHFYQSDSKRKTSPQINLILTRILNPEFTTVLPSVDKTNESMWKESSKTPIDLYDGHEASFDFSPQAGKGKSDGWTYQWLVDGKVLESNADGKWTYMAKNTSSEPIEHKISVKIKNVIQPQGEGKAENVGLDEEREYRVKIHPKVVFPKYFTLTDVNNQSNIIAETHATRLGNEISAVVEKATGGYAANGFEYDWSGTKEYILFRETSWKETPAVSFKSDHLESEDHTYGLEIRNKGPRGTIWDKVTLPNQILTVYNRPKTPKSIVQKGNGNSGTMIITTDVTDADLQENDYYLVFGYTDETGDHTFAAQKQANPGQVRWSSSYSGNQMTNAFVYAAWVDSRTNVLVTSGRRMLSEVDENWDDSDYNFNSNNMTRAIIDGETNGINDVEAVDFSNCDNIRVYNMNGMLLGSDVESLTPGIYVIRYQQNGEMKSKKLSIK